MDVYATSYGPYMGVKLFNTGASRDTVDFQAADDYGNALTVMGVASEGTADFTNVRYTDGRDDHWLVRVNVRSHAWNSGQYFINGLLRY